MRKFSDITDRIETVRTQLGLNKSTFSSKMGIKAQTYNNFIGKQGSKPNMELFTGIVRVFNVDPMWLLSGQGEPFPGGGAVGPLPPGMAGGPPGPVKDDAHGDASGNEASGNGDAPRPAPHAATVPPREAAAPPPRPAAERRLVGGQRYVKGTVAQLKLELELLLAPTHHGRTPLLSSDWFRDPQVEHAANVIIHRFWAHPAETAAALIDVLEQCREICDDLHWIASHKQKRGE